MGLSRKDKKYFAVQKQLAPSIFSDAIRTAEAFLDPARRYTICLELLENVNTIIWLHHVYDNMTLLHCAIIDSQLDVVTLLAAQKIGLHAPKIVSPWALAKKYGNPDIIGVLRFYRYHESGKFILEDMIPENTE